MSTTREIGGTVDGNGDSILGNGGCGNSSGSSIINSSFSSDVGGCSKSGTSTSAQEQDEMKEERNVDENIASTIVHVVFDDTFGVLEHVLSFLAANDLLHSTTLVSQRWKVASRNDSLWIVHIEDLWKDKVGMNLPTSTSTTKMNEDIKNDDNSTATNTKTTRCYCTKNLIFWRSLYTHKAIERMSQEQIQSIFSHPLLVEKRSLLDSKRGDTIQRPELQRFLQVHMLDVMSDPSTTSSCPTTTSSVISSSNLRRSGGGHDDTSGSSSSSSSSASCSSRWHTHFFNDIYYGSYVCSLLDSRRESITTIELCTPYGFDMYFKISIDDVEDPDDQPFLTIDPDSDRLSYLYHHSTCYFEEQNHDFRIVLKEQHEGSYNHPQDLKWRWVVGDSSSGSVTAAAAAAIGKRIQVGPYPPLTVRRNTKNWGWKLENTHVVLVFRDH